MLAILMRCNGYRLSRLNGNLSAALIRVAMMESSSIDDTAITTSFFAFTGYSSIISLLA